MNNNFKDFRLHFNLWLLIALSTLIFAGCHSDLEQVKIDFSKKGSPAPSVIKDSLLLNVAVSAMTSPQETFYYYKELLNYLGAKTKRSVNFKQRKTYQEINELLFKGELDLAFICSGAYVSAMESGRINLLVIPVINGRPTYQSYLVVPANSPAKSIADLRGKRFAFTDTLSFTGCLYPKYLIRQIGYSPDDYFSMTIFTHGHDKAIQAVARGMTHGACVDGLIYDFFNVRQPEKVAGIKIIERSQQFGIPPVVVPVGLDPNLEEVLRETLLSMHMDSVGKVILEELMIDYFTVSHDSLYDPIRKMRSELSGFFHE